ncbi:unnamed protein product, partial [Urochloa humidicola]
MNCRMGCFTINYQFQHFQAKGYMTWSASHNIVKGRDCPPQIRGLDSLHEDLNETESMDVFDLPMCLSLCCDVPFLLP